MADFGLARQPCTVTLRIPIMPAVSNSLVSLLFWLCLLSPPLALGQNADIAWLRQANVHRNTGLDGTARFVSGSAGPVAAGGTLAGLGAAYVWGGPAERRQAWMAASAFAAERALNYGLKLAINRPRPYQTYPDLQPFYHPQTSSLPSGHAGVAFQFATSLTLACPRWYVAVPAYGWATAVGYSRLHMGVHYPSDVLAGAALGAGTALATHWLARRLQGRQTRRQAAP